MSSIMSSFTSCGIAFPISNLLFFWIKTIAMIPSKIPMIIEVMESHKEFFVIYDIHNPIAAMSTPPTAIESSYTTAKVMGSAC